MSNRIILFYGNCQALYLHRLFSEQLVPLTGDTAIFLGIGVADFGNEAHAAAFRKADILVDQVFDTPDPIPQHLLSGLRQRLRMPNLRGDFLWPFGTREPHPNHKQFPKSTRRFYGEELGDGFLNRMILEHVPEQEAVDRYLGISAARPRNLQRIYEISLDRQRRRDRIAGIEVADFIEANLPAQSLFSTPGHPREALLRRIARPVLHELVGAALAEQALDGQYHAFSWITAPIHPVVARQLALKYIGEDTRYLVYEEDFLTFRQHAHRYMRGESVPELWDAMAGYGKVGVEATLALLEQGMAKAPLSPRAHRFQSRVAREQNRPADAIAAGWRAVGLEPDEPGNWHALVSAHLLAGQADLAERIARLAVSRLPRHSAVYHLLCDVLAARRDAGELVAVGRRLRALHPGNERALVALARHLQAVGEAAEAEAYAREAKRLQPRSPLAAAVAAEVFERQGRTPEAIAVVRAALAGGQADASMHGRLGELLLRDGDARGAEAAFRQAIVLDRGIAGLHSGLADALDRQGRRPEALAVVRAALAAGLAHAQVHGRLGQLLQRDGDLAGAEAGYRQAIALEPAIAGFHNGLADVLDRQGRRAEAIAVLRGIIATGQANSHIHSRLANLLNREDDFLGAAAAYRQAIALEPAIAGFHGALAETLDRQGRRAEGIAVLRALIAAGHADAHTHSRLGHLLGRDGLFADAEAAYRQAIALAPSAAGFHNGLADTLARQGRRPDAAAVLRDFLATGPTDPQMQARLAQLSA